MNDDETCIIKNLSNELTLMKEIKIFKNQILKKLLFKNGKFYTFLKELIFLFCFTESFIQKKFFENMLYDVSLDQKITPKILTRFQALIFHESAHIRALTIKTSSSINHKSFIKFLFNNIERLLNDSDSNVKRVTLFSLCRLYHYEKKKKLGLDLNKCLNKLIHDSDPMVLSGVIALQNFLFEKSITLDMFLTIEIVLKLLNDFSKVNEWGKIQILDFLMRFKPSLNDLLTECLDILINYLKIKPFSVLIKVIKLIFYFKRFINNFDNKYSYLKNIIGQSFDSLQNKNPEIQFLVLEEIVAFLSNEVGLIKFNIEIFFLKKTDPFYLKEKKIFILTKICDESNVNMIIKHFLVFVYDSDYSRMIVKAIGKLGLKFITDREKFIEIILNLMFSENVIILEEIITLIVDILRVYKMNIDLLVIKVFCYYKVIKNEDAILSMIWLFGEYYEKLIDEDQVFLDLMTDFDSYSYVVQMTFLTTMAKVFFKSSTEISKIIEQVFNWCIDESMNPYVKDKASYYKTMLSQYSSSNLCVKSSEIKSIFLGFDQKILA